MPRRARCSYRGDMDKIRHLQWPLVLGLGALALIRPLMNIVGVMPRIEPVGPLAVTALISLVWIAVVGLTRVAQPVLTLVFAGLVYGVFSIVLSAILSPILTGELQGPLATPFAVAVIPVLAVNAVWGALAGVLAAGLQRATGRTAGRSTTA